MTRGCQAHIDTFVCVTTHLATALPRCPLFHIYTCITRLAPSVVDNMWRQALLRWMIQFFNDTDILNRRVDNIDTVRLATLQSQDWTTLQQSDLATPHTGRGAAGKTHTSYMTTWRSVGVRRGNVAYCLAFSAHTQHIYMHTYVLVSSRATWHWLLGQGSLLRESQGGCGGIYNCTSVVLLG